MANERIVDCSTGQAITQAYTPMPDLMPQVVTRRQAKRALLAAGLLDDADAAIAQAGEEAQIDWADALEFRRDNPLITAIGGALGLTSEQIDDLFRAAVTYT